MLEIYLFVNPLGEHCLEAERSVLQVAEEHHDTVHYQFLPLVNLHTVTDVMKRNRFDTHDLDMRNKIFKIIYAAALDYKAALFQGKRRGQEFLMQLQDALNFHHERYTDALISDLVSHSGLDTAMFREDRKSQLAVESFEADQRVACEMQIQHHPSAVVYNYADPEQDYGVMIEDCHSYEVLKQVCQGNFDAALAAQNPTNKRKQTIHIL
ncbi:DsbA family protein [Loigolactobacillus jiayinensis]|uniref:DsbA family protein n=1 Tax=Loigolactobacillus jiayinensis TaxID=2486016 RepID=A0ABW1R8T2_9LACO|nr:DsbA family protein [Loigolactobacillus jiayinensis]